MDQLIAEAAASPRQLTESEIAGIRAHVLSRPFDSRPISAGRRLSGVRDRRGRVLEANDELPSVEHHLLLRTVRDEQWPIGTSVEVFLDDLRRAVSHRAASIWTYRYRGEDYAGFVARNGLTPPARKRTAYVFVAYSATFGVLRTGYQLDDEEGWQPRDGVENLFRQRP